MINYLYQNVKINSIYVNGFDVSSEILYIEINILLFILFG